MEALRDYLNSLSVPEQTKFAERCGTTIGYLRKAISKKQELGIELVMEIEKNSKNGVRCEQMLPNVDFKYLHERRAKASSAA